MKLSFEDKKSIYNLHLQGYGYRTIAAIFEVDDTRIEYICVLADKHGIEKLQHSHTFYSKEFKLNAIHRVLMDGNSVWSVATDIGLPSKSILQNWIKSYVDNGYNVVTKKKGRPSTRDKEKEDGRRVGEGEQTPSRATAEEDYRERIIKKLQALAQEEEKKNENS